MQVVPLRPLANQTLQVQLNDQAIGLNVYQQLYGLYVDVLLNNTIVIGGVLAHNLNRIIRDAYIGVVGDFAFVDTQGEDDPIYTGLGERFQLVYFDEEDIAAYLYDADAEA